MITVGISGCGFAGSALKTWLEEDNKDVTVVVSDRRRGWTTTSPAHTR